MAPHIASIAQQSRGPDQPHDSNDASLPPSSLSSSPPQHEDPENGLRNQPTVILDDSHGAEKAEDNATAAPSQGFLAKVTQKLGLNSIMLMSMFKSVSPVPPQPCVLQPCGSPN